MKASTPSAVALALLLAACGGGSDSGSGSAGTGGGTGAGGGSGSGGGNQTTQQLTVTPQPMTICRHSVGEIEDEIERELVIYDDNWQIVSRHSANAEGVMQVNLPGQSSVNYGVLSRKISGSSTYTTLETYADHPIKSTFYGAIDLMQAIDCECTATSITITSELGHLSDQINIMLDNTTNYAFNHQLTRLADNSIRFEDVSICQNTDGIWPSILVQANTGNQAVAGQLTDYDASEPLQLYLDQLPIQIPIVLNDDVSYIERAHRLTSGNQLLSPETQPSGQFAFFPAFENVQYLVTGGRSQVTELAAFAPNGARYTGSRHVYSTHELSTNSIGISLPNESNYGPLLELKANITEAQPIQYDLRNQDALVVFQFSSYTMFENGDLLTHIHFGPSQGKFSLTVFPDDVEQPAAIQWKNSMMSLWGYSNINSYQDYLNNDQAQVGDVSWVYISSNFN